MTRHWRWLFAVALLVGAAVPFVLGGQQVLARLVTVPVGWLALLGAMIAVCWNLNAWRLRLMLNGRAPGLGHGAAVATVMATEFTLNATPGGSGAPFTLAALLRRHGVAPAQATAVLAVDQLTDLLVFAALLPTVALYGLARYLDLAAWWQVAVPFALMLAALAGVGLLARFQRRVLIGSGDFLAWLGLRRRRRLRLARAVLRFRRGLEETLAVPRRRLLLMFSLCLCHWLLRYSVIYVAVLALGEHLDWVYGFFVQMVAMGAGHLTLLPGGAGGAEVAGAALLNPWLTSVTTATTIVVWRFFTFYWYLLAGGAVMLWLAARTGQPLLDGK